MRMTIYVCLLVGAGIGAGVAMAASGAFHPAYAGCSTRC